jgi:hypothetical protein
VPPGSDALTDAHPEGAAGLDGGRLADQLDPDLGTGPLGRGRGGAGGSSEGTEHEEGE